MPVKRFYFDVETTGLDKDKAGLTQIAAIVVIDGKEVDSINLDINPYTYRREVIVSEEALSVTNKTKGMLESYPNSDEQFKKFIKFLDKHINKFDKTDKFIPIGYNSSFDMGFLQSWFADNLHKFFGSYFEYKDVDVYKFVIILKDLGLVDTSNHKLMTVANHFGVLLDADDAHDALNDIRATMKLHERLIDEFIKFPTGHIRP